MLSDLGSESDAQTQRPGRGAGTGRGVPSSLPPCESLSGRTCWHRDHWLLEPERTRRLKKATCAAASARAVIRKRATLAATAPSPAAVAHHHNPRPGDRQHLPDRPTFPEPEAMGFPDPSIPSSLLSRACSALRRAARPPNSLARALAPARGGQLGCSVAAKGARHQRRRRTALSHTLHPPSPPGCTAAAAAAAAQAAEYASPAPPTQCPPPRQSTQGPPTAGTDTGTVTDTAGRAPVQTAGCAMLNLKVNSDLRVPAGR